MAKNKKLAPVDNPQIVDHDVRCITRILMRACSDPKAQMVETLNFINTVVPDEVMAGLIVDYLLLDAEGPDPKTIQIQQHLALHLIDEFELRYTDGVRA